MSMSQVAEALLAFVAARRYEVGFIAGAIVLECGIRSRYWRQLRAPSHLVDLGYALFYRLGFAALLLDRPIWAFVKSHVTLHALTGAPEWVRVVGYLVCLDFAYYWIHRVMHAVPALWAFHQVHHSQDELTILTTYRIHPFEMWMRSFFGPLLFMLVFGVQPLVWVWVSILWDVHLNLSHLDVDWTYGPLRRFIVSPVAHAIHHSVEPRHMHRNYGASLFVWDRIFGTADTGTERPHAVGLPGWTVRESMVAQFVAPFRGVLRHLRGLPMDDLAPLVDEAQPVPPAAPASAPVRTP